MAPESSAVLASAATTTLTAAAGAALLTVVARRRPSVAALGAPVVVVLSLALGVAVASRSMLIGAEDSRTLLLVLLGGAPVAVAVGVVLARRVTGLEEQAARARAARERDRDVERSRRETISWISHDLRTPLAGIRALAETVEIDDAADGTEDRAGRAAAAARRIVHEVDRMDAMVEDILELSRLRGPAAARRQPAGFDDLVSDAVGSVSALAGPAGVEVRGRSLAGEVVEVDAAGVTRAVANVVRNAVQHTPPGGVVDVRTSASDERVEVEVDDGCGGIAPADLEHVFEPGWRADGSRHERGMGLGLAIVREVARAHGGDATVENLADGSGCRVRLWLPQPGGQVLTRT
jgi:signal transduction histidine kinase